MVELRTLYSVAIEIALGIYILAEHFLQAEVLHALIIITMVCAYVFVVFTLLQAQGSLPLAINTMKSLEHLDVAHNSSTYVILPI